MTETARKIARSARRLGYRSVTLGQFTDADWRELKARVGEPDASDRELANAVDTVLAWEQGKDAPTGSV